MKKMLFILFALICSPLFASQWQVSADLQLEIEGLNNTSHWYSESSMQQSHPSVSLHLLKQISSSRVYLGMHFQWQTRNLSDKSTSDYSNNWGNIYSFGINAKVVGPKISRITPFIHLLGGFSFGEVEWQYENNSGIPMKESFREKLTGVYSQISLGASYPLTSKLDFYMQGGYQAGRYSSKVEDSTLFVSESNYTFQSWNIGFGIQFDL